MSLSLQDWANVASVGMGLAALGALYYAWDQIRSSRADSHEATAKSLRSDYLLQALQYPELANPDTSKLDFANEEYCGTRDKFFDYTWFVSYVLAHCDELLRLSGDDDWNWEQIVENNISYHWDYIKSPLFARTEHNVLSPRLRRKIEEIDAKKTAE